MQPRLAVVATLALAACTSHPNAAPPGGPGAPRQPPATPGYDATRWIPAHPTYAGAARTVRDAQRAARDLVGTLGMPLELDELAASALLKQTAGIDLLSADALAEAGIDLGGGAAVFSEDVNPTVVFHLASPDKMKAFLASHLPKSGASQAVPVGGVDVITIGDGQIHVSWAVDHDWIWVHYRIGGDAGTTWFEHSRAGGGGTLPDWQRAERNGKPAVIGFVDLHALAGATLASLPGNAAECVRRFDSIGNLDITLDADEHTLSTRLSVDIGTLAHAVEASLLAPPAGWGQTSAHAPLAAAWNLDIPAATAWIAPCYRGGDGWQRLRSSGVRAARGVMLSFDDETTFSGAVALDLANAKYLTDQLDQLPLRSHLEKDRTFGAYKGHHLSIPMLFAIDYVLTPTLGLVGRGDGLLERLTAGAPAAGHPPLVAIDLAPPAMSEKQWQGLSRLLDFGKDTVPSLMHWKALHASLGVEGEQLVIDASAERR